MARDGQFPEKESQKNTSYNLTVPHLEDNMVRFNVSAENKALLITGFEAWNDWCPKL